MEQVLIVLLAIFIASILNILLKKLELPTAIGYIFTGIIISQLFNITPDNSSALEHISELGIVLLMFTIGLEFSFSELKAMKKQVFIYGTLQVILSGVVFAALAILLFNFSQKSAIVIGFALALSSTAIVLKMLNENGDIHAGYGRKALGILLFQDIAVIPILIIIDIFTKDVELSTLLLKTAIHMVLFFTLLIIIGKYLLNSYLEFSIKTKNQEIFLLAIFFTVLASAEVAHLFGFSYSLGAFFAGMLLAESDYKYQIEADLAPFRDLLLGLFFFAVGNRIELGVILENILIIVILVILIMLLKALITFLVLIREQKRTAFKTALALSQIGEFALAIFVLAQNHNFINSITAQILATVVIFSMILTPFIINNLSKIADLIFSEPKIEYKISSVGFRNHIIVCGYGPLGVKVCNSLKRKYFDYVLIEHDLALYNKALQDNQPAFFGNAAQLAVLEALNVKEACGVVITFHNLEKIRLIAKAVLDLAPKAHIVVRVREESERDAIKNIGIDSIIVMVDSLARDMTNELLYCNIKSEIKG